MLENETRKAILDLINREVVPAVGCTEPMSVALCTAKATELLGCKPTHIKVLLSANILKNAMGVGIPGTGMIGLPIAVSLGSLIGKSAYQLEVIKDLTPESLAAGKQFVAENRICIGLKENNTEKLYVEVTVESEGHQATTIISGAHTCFVFASKDDEVLFDKRHKSGDESEENDIQLNMKLVWDFAMTSPINELSFILKTKEYNLRAAQESRKGNYGHCLGKTMDRPLSHGIFGNSIFSHIIATTASACDARMGGAMIPVMSNSGSGNQGITATMPVVVVARHINASEEQLIRALFLSHLMAIYIHSKLPKLSALCAVTTAAMGSCAGVAWLLTESFDAISMAISSMIGDISGIICDGAANSCAMKVSTSVTSSYKSILMALDNTQVTGNEGIVEHQIDRSINNLCAIASRSMQYTDRQVIEIMVSKPKS